MFILLHTPLISLIYKQPPFHCHVSCHIRRKKITSTLCFWIIGPCKYIGIYFMGNFVHYLLWRCASRCKTNLKSLDLLLLLMKQLRPQTRVLWDANSFAFDQLIAFRASITLQILFCLHMLISLAAYRLNTALNYNWRREREQRRISAKSGLTLFISSFPSELLTTQEQKPTSCLHS